MHTEKYFLNQAYKEAIKAFNIDEVPVGCVLVCQDKIIARGHNKKETLKQSCAHAEIQTIQKAQKKKDNWHLDDCVLYVTLEPCIMCCGAIIQARIKHVVFGAIDSKSGAVISTCKLFDLPTNNHKVSYSYKNNLPKCGTILSDYFKSKRIKKGCE